MSRPLLSSAATYTKNVAKHLGRIVLWAESPADAFRGIARDTAKLKRAFRQGGSISEGQRHDAKRLVEEGRQVYNQKRYPEAEQIFREAVLADASYALASTYLGYALYKQGRFHEAGVYWNQAIEAEPGSEAARKARSKLKVIKAKTAQVTDWLDDHIA
ncbi:MAG: tetratricopeptide repeat protein [Candidatus Hydrogenedentes bacterium]|nr:tetratricopeptide repeat protein [Candidatus Hydrogenedentota bacterium]